MAINLESIKSSKREMPKRILLLGKAKSGKSTLASLAPSPIFIPIKGEEGIDDIETQSFPVAENSMQVMEMLGVLYQDDHDYKTVVIDSISVLEMLIWDEACRINGGVDSIEKVGGGYGKGFTEALRGWRGIIEGLDWLRKDKGMGCILIGHVKVEKFNDPSLEPYDRYSCDINKKASELLTRWVDGVLFLSRKTVVKKDEAGMQKQNRAIDTGGGVPYMYTQERPAHPGGGRGAWGALPYELPLSWDVLSKALEGGK